MFNLLLKSYLYIMIYISFKLFELYFNILIIWKIFFWKASVREKDTFTSSINQFQSLPTNTSIWAFLVSTDPLYATYVRIFLTLVNVYVTALPGPPGQTDTSNDGITPVYTWATFTHLATVYSVIWQITLCNTMWQKPQSLNSF